MAEIINFKEKLTVGQPTKPDAKNADTAARPANGEKGVLIERTLVRIKKLREQAKRLLEKMIMLEIEYRDPLKNGTRMPEEAMEKLAAVQDEVEEVLSRIHYIVQSLDRGEDHGVFPEDE
ncbi:MAG: hypothetical protein MUC28_01850 [Planctomycetes bacterium]|nr:hypothetical protein [Planctomycetota bacterium]